MPVGGQTRVANPLTGLIPKPNRAAKKYTAKRIIAFIA